MVTGQRAFTGENAVDVIGAILHKEPTPLNQLSHGLPHEVERIINKALRKDPEARYQTAGDLLTDLKDVRQELQFQDQLERTVPPSGDQPKTQTGTAPSTNVPSLPTSSAEFITQEVKKHKLGLMLGALIVMALIGGVVWFLYLKSGGSNAPISSIAVLPFQNKSSDANTEDLSDGLAESLIYRLSQLPNLKVSPTSGSCAIKARRLILSKLPKNLAFSRSCQEE
jgi:serine/threonine protein kinase